EKHPSGNLEILPGISQHGLSPKPAQGHFTAQHCEAVRLRVGMEIPTRNSDLRGLRKDVGRLPFLSREKRNLPQDFLRLPEQVTGALRVQTLALEFRAVQSGSNLGGDGISLRGERTQLVFEELVFGVIGGTARRQRLGGNVQRILSEAAQRRIELLVNGGQVLEFVAANRPGKGPLMKILGQHPPVM